MVDSVPTAPTVQAPRGVPYDPDPRPAAPLQYRELARYDLLAEHGRGGLGRVMRARDRELGRNVAIKELLRRGRSAELRFFREALITARLEHPGIVPVHEAGRWSDGTPFYSMKLVSGRPLRELIDDASSSSARGTIAARLALVPHVVAVADAIAYAHARRIVHRDLKPSNVMVGDFGETVVIDWGLAKDLSTTDREDIGDPYRAPATPDVTEAGAVMGTPAFMAPEQARGEPGDERADVYALGAMLYAVLAGQSPYQGTASTDIVRAVVEGPPPPLATLAPGVPAELVAIAGAAMDRDPARRLPSASAFGDELRRYLQGQLVESHRYTVVDRALRWMRRHRELSAAVAVAAALLLVLGAAAVSRIVDERNTADRERRRAEAALRDAQAQREGLILNHARVEAERDPTAALGWLAAYRGDDTSKAQELAAIAVGRSAATFSRNRGGPVIGQAVALSFDPPFVVAVSGDRTLRGWRGGRRAPSTLVTGIGSTTKLKVAWSPRGEIAYAKDGAVHVLDGRGISRVALTVDDVQSLSFSRDGGVLFAASRSGQLVVTGAGGDQRFQLPDSAGRLHRAALAPDGDAVAACDEQGRLWYARLGQAWRDRGRCAVLVGAALAFAPDGTRLLMQLGDGIEVVEVDTGRRLPLAMPAAPVALAAFLADGHVLVGNQDGSVHDVDLDGGSSRRLLATAAAATRADESIDGRLVIGFEDGAVVIIDRDSGHVTPIVGFRSAIVGVHWSPDGHQLLAADHNEVRISPAPPSRIWATGGNGSYRAVYAPDGRWIAVDGERGEVHVADRRATGRRITRRLRGHTGSAFGLLFHREGLVSASSDGTVRTWDVATGAARVGADHGGTVRAIAGASTGPVYTADGDAHIRAQVPGTAPPRALLATDHLPRRLVLSPDGGQLLALGERGHVDLVATATGAVRTVVTRDPPFVGSAFNPDGSFFVLAGLDGRIEIRATTGERLHVGHYGARCGAVVVSAGDDIAVACGPLLVRIGRDAGVWRARWRELASSIQSLGLSPDGAHLAAGTVGGVVYVEEVATGRLAARQVAAAMVSSVVFSPDGAELAVTSQRPELHAIAVADLSFVPAAAAALQPWLAARRDDDLDPMPATAPSPGASPTSL